MKKLFLVGLSVLHLNICMYSMKNCSEKELLILSKQEFHFLKKLPRELLSYISDFLPKFDIAHFYLYKFLVHLKNHEQAHAKSEIPLEVKGLITSYLHELIINRNAQDVYNFLSDFRNFEKLMPEQIVNWHATESSCSFTIKGMTTLGMKIKNKIQYSLVEIEHSGKAPFDFTLKCVISDKQEQSGVKLVLEADLSPILKMLAEKPLTNFLNLLVSKLAAISNQV